MKNFILALVFLTLCPLIHAEEKKSADLLTDISKQLPGDWAVKLCTYQGKCFIQITTSEIETKASMYGNADPKEKKIKLRMNIQLMPRYSKAMLARVKAHNKPINKKLEGLDYYSEKYQKIAATLIDEPIFYDDTYGFRICSPSRIPKNEEHRQELIKFLKAISGKWKSYNPKKPKVKDELVRILTK